MAQICMPLVSGWLSLQVPHAHVRAMARAGSWTISSPRGRDGPGNTNASTRTPGKPDQKPGPVSEHGWRSAITSAPIAHRAENQLLWPAGRDRKRPNLISRPKQVKRCRILSDYEGGGEPSPPRPVRDNSVAFLASFSAGVTQGGAVTRQGGIASRLSSPFESPARCPARHARPKIRPRAPLF